MSDDSELATRAATVLRDQSIIDLKDQIKVLEERARMSMAVEVTGPGRNPIYARGQFDHDGGYSEWKPNQWRVDLSSETPCRLSNLRDIEIWISGFKQFDPSTAFLVRHDSRAFALIGNAFSSFFLWVDLGRRFEELEERNLVDQNLQDFMVNHRSFIHRMCESFAQDDRLCDIKCLYQDAKDVLPLVQSIPGAAASLDVFARNKDAVIAALRKLDPHFRREGANNHNLYRTVMEDIRRRDGSRARDHLAVILDRLMIAITESDVDVQDQEALQAFLVNYGMERMFGDIFI